MCVYDKHLAITARPLEENELSPAGPPVTPPGRASGGYCPFGISARVAARPRRIRCKMRAALECDGLATVRQCHAVMARPTLVFGAVVLLHGDVHHGDSMDGR